MIQQNLNIYIEYRKHGDEIYVRADKQLEIFAEYRLRGNLINESLLAENIAYVIGSGIAEQIMQLRREDNK